MNKINNGGTAYPMQDQQAIHAYAMAACADITDPDERDRVYMQARAEAIGGMTVRDKFAGKAMAAFISGAMADGSTIDEATFGIVAGVAYKMADAMLVEREKGGKA